MEKNEGGGWGRRDREDNQTTISSDFFKGEREKGEYANGKLLMRVCTSICAILSMIWYVKEFEHINLEEIYPTQVVTLPAYAKI